MPSNISVSGGGNSFADYFESGATASAESTTSATGAVVDLVGNGVLYLSSTSNAIADIEFDGKIISNVNLTALVSNYAPAGVSLSASNNFAFSKSIKITKLDSNPITWGVLI